jgi:hypothetical protein
LKNVEHHLVLLIQNISTSLGVKKIKNKKFRAGFLLPIIIINKKMASNRNDGYSPMSKCKYG